MKVYFSAPSLTLPENKNLYSKIIDNILKSGGILVSKWFEDRTKQNAEDLFEQTTDDIKNSDVLVAEITFPSTGVGQQIALALSWKIPVIALKRSGVVHESKFTQGNKSPYFKVAKYNLSSLEKVLKNNFEKVKRNKYIKFNFVTTREINDFLKKKSEEKNTSKSELLREIVEEWKIIHS